MICLEIISVRTATCEEAMTALELCQSIRSSNPSAGPGLDLKVYCSVSYETDLSVHIRWEASGGRQDKSTLGLELVSAFSSLGLVNHTVWREVLPGKAAARVHRQGLM